MIEQQLSLSDFPALNPPHWTRIALADSTQQSLQAVIKLPETFIVLLFCYCSDTNTSKESARSYTKMRGRSGGLAEVDSEVELKGHGDLAGE